MIADIRYTADEELGKTAKQVRGSFPGRSHIARVRRATNDERSPRFISASIARTRAASSRVMRIRAAKSIENFREKLKAIRVDRFTLSFIHLLSLFIP